MAKINKNLTKLIEATSPERQKDLGDLCNKSAETMRDTAGFLDAASKAFFEGRFTDGCAFINQAEDCIAKA